MSLWETFDECASIELQMATLESDEILNLAFIAAVLQMTILESDD